MIMWELTTGCKPFVNVAHDLDLIFEILDGKRPEITEDTPECFANLMKSCWDPDPKKRPSMTEISKTLNSWSNNRNTKSMERIQFNQADKKRLELIKLNKLIPQVSHPVAAYTSRPLSFFISKCSSINSFSKGMYKKFDLDFFFSNKYIKHIIFRLYFNRIRS